MSLPPSGFAVALQFWQGDFSAAMRLARLLADLEPARRDDVLLAFCRRPDTSVDARPNGLWPVTMDVHRITGVTI